MIEARALRKVFAGGSRGEVVELSMKAATEVLGRNVGSEDDRRLVTELVSSTRGQAS